MSTLPRSSRNIIIITTSIFIVVLVLTMKLETDTMSIGYPWTFYTYSHTGGDLQQSTSRSIQPAFFILEWLMIAAFVVVMKEGIKKIRR